MPISTTSTSKYKNVDRPSVGLILSKKFGYLGVVDSIAGSPAAKAGLATGDMIESIKGITTRDMPLAYAQLLLEGESGQSVELSVVRVAAAGAGHRDPHPRRHRAAAGGRQDASR